MPPEVAVVENHDEVYEIWRKAGFQNKSVVHVDAHHDMWWIEDSRCATIANFLCPALKDGIVKQLFWVVPDGTWESRAGRRAVFRHLAKISKNYPDSAPVKYTGHDRIATAVLGRQVTVCSLSGLPAIDETVLLDLDTDFLVIPEVSYGKADSHSAMPWRRPGELLLGLEAARIRAEFVTIAYSVEGGYTPLKWKYLGDELAARLRGGSNGPAVRGMELLLEGEAAGSSGSWEAAAEAYERALELLPGSAAVYYRQALLAVDICRPAEARRLYSLAIAADPTYRTPYNNLGLHLRYAGRHEKAVREYRRALMLDPDDAYACLGLGYEAIRKRNWTDAEALLRKAIDLDPGLTDAHRSLAKLLVRRRQYAEAIALYERSLRVATTGRKPLSDLIVTDRASKRMLDPKHGETHARLARLYARKGDIARAIAGYRMGVGMGGGRPANRLRLAVLYIRQQQWGASRQELWLAWGAVLHDIGRRLGRVGAMADALAREMRRPREE